MSKVFDKNMIDAVKVQFLHGIFSEDFVERGMKAWLTKVERKEEHDFDNYKGYEVFFDFTEFEAENDKYFSACYFDSTHQPTLTAKESGYYKPKYSVYLDIKDDKFDETLQQYMRLVD